MLRSYLTIAIRSLARHRLHTLIGVLGLALGIGTGILLLRYVQHELSFDAYHEKLDRVYRVIEATRREGEIAHNQHVPSALAAALRENVPEVEQAAHANRIWVRMKAGDRTLSGIRVAGMEREMFDVLDIPFLAGTPGALYEDPSAIAVRARLARRLFGKEDPIGKTVSVISANYGGERVIRAVVANQPRSSFRFDYIQAPPAEPRWTGPRGDTYVLLREGADRHAAEAKIEDILDRHLDPKLAARRHYELYPFSRVYLHLTSDYNVGRIYEPWGDIAQVRLFGAVAVIVLIIACINFTNLAIARSAGRAREVGLRKVTGAHRGQLAAQFLSESVLVAFVSLALGLLALRFVLPEFNAFFRRRLALDLLADPSLLLGVVAVTLLVGLAAGAYPALVLSAFQPADTLRGTFQGRIGGAWVRKGLIVLQFTASIVLIIGSAVIYAQFDFIRHSDFGYDRSDHLVHTNPYVTDKFLKTADEIRLSDRYETVKQAFLDHPDAIEATAYKQDFGLTTWGKHTVVMEGHEKGEWRLPVIEVDDDFIDVFRMEILAGRTFDEAAFPADHASAHSDSGVAFIVNEAGVKHLGLDLAAPVGTPSSPIGQPVRWKIRQGDITGSIVGVVNDFHYVPLTEPIEPIMLAFRTKNFFNLTIRVREGGLDGAVAHFEKTWNHFAPNNPFWHTFWERNLTQGYRQQRRTQALAHVAGGIAVFLACIGLFALASHAAETRQKEIAVRKALGATTSSVVLLVSREFLALVLIASTVAVPVAYPFARDWLDEFAYRMDLGPTVFAFSIVLNLAIAQLTVTYHAWRAAQTDPAAVLHKA